MQKKIPFSPPDISNEEINKVVEVLKSGWITSGPKVAEFEKQVQEYCGVKHAVAVSSATAGMELVLKVFNVGAGDEVITTPYTYTSTASVITQRGIKPTFVDVEKDSFLIDIDKVVKTVTSKTKAIMTVDIAGVPVDYDKLKNALKAIGREDIILISDSAHSFGASYKNQKVGGQLHFHIFSLHAVKNLTTAEGGMITFNDNSLFGKEDLYKEFKYTSLMGQTKDAFSKMKAGSWRYDIITNGLKCNMTDILAAVGLGQIDRYEEMLGIRENIFDIYAKALSNKEWAIIPFKENEIKKTSFHLFPLRLKGFSEDQRNMLIQRLAEMDIATNVHFIPLPCFTYYKSVGYKIEDYPNAYAQYANEISVPVYSTLSLEDAEYVIQNLIKIADDIKAGK